MHISTLNKYELGERRPTPAFMYSVSKVLDLSQEETSALIDAYVADITQEFMTEYIELLKSESVDGRE